MKRQFLKVILGINLKPEFLTLLLFAAIPCAYGQVKKEGNDNGKCEYAKNTTDEFTKDRIVETLMYKIDDKKVLKGGWSISEVIENSYRVLLYVSAHCKNGSNALEFTYEASDGAPSAEQSFTFNEVYLMLINDKIIKMNGETSDHYYTDNMDWYYNSLKLPISDENWNTLKTTPVKKIRLSYDGNEGRTLELKEKYTNRIMTLINCIDVLGIPKTNTLNITENKPSPENEVNSNAEMPKPTYDTASISLYKQWSAKVILGKDGMPIRLQSKSYFSFNRDGTYTAITITKENRKINSKGKFELLNDNKLVIFYPEDTNIPSYTAVISKLTNKELEIKGELFDTFYTVY